MSQSDVVTPYARNIEELSAVEALDILDHVDESQVAAKVVKKPAAGSIFVYDYRLNNCRRGKFDSAISLLTIKTLLA